MKLTEMSVPFPPIGKDGMTALHRWRIKRKLTGREAADYMGISVATYYRYENGSVLHLLKANHIVNITHGEVRYRDLVAGFKPEYA